MEEDIDAVMFIYLIFLMLWYVYARAFLFRFKAFFACCE
jgi:hypothetical protein